LNFAERAQAVPIPEGPWERQLRSDGPALPGNAHGSARSVVVGAGATEVYRLATGS
jgi:hypothetical protein